MPPVVIGVDTSGSISEADLAQFAAEVQAVCDEVQPEKIHVIYADAAVNKTEDYGAGEMIKLTPCGGGGTHFAPLFGHVEAEGIQPACVIYLTDLYGDFPKQAPDYPVLWAVFNDYSRPPQAPFGETLYAKVGRP